MVMTAVGHVHMSTCDVGRCGTVGVVICVCVCVCLCRLVATERELVLLREEKMDFEEKVGVLQGRMLVIGAAKLACVHTYTACLTLSHTCCPLGVPQLFT